MSPDPSTDPGHGPIRCPWPWWGWSWSD